MPKLIQTIQVKAPDLPSCRTVETELEWKDRYLLFKKNMPTGKLDLSATLTWKHVVEKVKFNILKPKQSRTKRTIVLIMPGPKGTREWHLCPEPGEVDTWIFWLLTSLQAHAVNVQTENQIPPGLVKTQNTLQRFDSQMRLFAQAAESLLSQEKITDDPVSQFDHYNNVPSPDKKTRYNFNNEQKLKRGGSGTSLTLVKKKNKTVILDDGEAYQPPDEPVVLKKASILSPIDLLKQDGMSDAARGLIRETQILAAVGAHPNIIRFVDAVATKHAIYLFLEKGEGDLEDRVRRKPLNRDELLAVAYGALEGLGRMHEHFVFHLDIKPGNIVFFANNVPKVIDFGLACCPLLDSYENMSRNFLSTGTNGYIPPESFLGKNPRSNQIVEALAKRDAYALGMTFFDVLIGPCFNLSYPKESVMPEPKIKWWDDQIKKKLATVKDGELMALISLSLEMIRPDVQMRPTLIEARDMFRLGCGKTVETQLARLRALARQDKIDRSRKALDRFTMLTGESKGQTDMLKDYVLGEESAF